LYQSSTLIGTGTADATTGVWTITSSVLSANTYSITAKQLDAAGNLSAASSALSVVVDTVAAAPTITALASLLAQPVLSGTGEAGATLEITDTVGGVATVLGTAKVSSLGAWSFQASSITSGAHSITARQTDIAGNVSNVSSAYAFTVDSTLMGLPALVSASDSATKGDAITNNAAPTLTGVAVTKGGTVQVYDGTTLLGSTTSDASTGVWTFTPASSLAGSATGVVHSITAKDVTANKTSSVLSLRIDTSAVAPSITAPVSAHMLMRAAINRGNGIRPPAPPESATDTPRR
jgi:hypothetical protein